MDGKSVATYLQQHPEFFEQYADLLADIYVPHPHNGRAIPIAERQILNLREKARELENKLKELVQFGNENDLTGERLHRATLALFNATDLETTLQVLYHSLRDDFNVPEATSRLWGRVPEQSYLAEIAATSLELHSYTDSLVQPYCGPQSAFESLTWFENGERLRSFVYIPLRTDHTFGVLMLASDDPNRFHADMGTLYLTRLGELASVAIYRFFPQD